MTLAHLASAIGSSKSHLCLIEFGERALTPAVAEAAALALGITANELRSTKPGDKPEGEVELVRLFREGTLAQQRALVEIARTIRAMDRVPEAEG